MGAFQSHDPNHEHPTSDAFDLTLEVTVAEGAQPPRHETPSASQFAIYANETVAVDGLEWVPVRTGLSFAMPFMLILLVRGTGRDWEVQEQVVDYDATDELVVRVRRPPAGGGAGKLTRIVAGSRVAFGVVLPIARPSSFTLCEPVPTDENDDEGESV